MAGGDPDVIAGLAPLFDAIGSLTVTMGPFGTGLAAKLARNLVQYGGWLAAYEGQVLAEAAGIDLSKLAQVVRASDALDRRGLDAHVPSDGGAIHRGRRRRARGRHAARVPRSPTRTCGRPCRSPPTWTWTCPWRR